MGRNTSIEWATHTFNPWIGCTKVSEACRNCYAEVYGHRFGVAWGPGKERRRTSPATWKQPVSWNRQVQALLSAGWDPVKVRPRVFSASLADWLDHEVPIEWLRDFLALVGSTPALTWMLLTKRPALWRERLEAVAELGLPGDPAFARAIREWLGGAHPKNVWIGATVEDQRSADERLPALYRIPTRVAFLSCEPLLGPLTLDLDRSTPRLEWIIAGGESGSGARPTHPSWARSLRDQAQRAGVPFFWKQWGEWAQVCPVHPEPGVDLDAEGCDLDPPSLLNPYPEDRVLCLTEGGFAHDIDMDGQPPGGAWYMARVGKVAAGRELDGRAWDEIPRG